MVFRRKPSPCERKNYGLEVVETLEKAGFDRQTTLVIGGSAMAMCGIRRTGDVDIIVPYFGIYDRLWQEKRTPNGIILRDKWGARRPFLETISAALPPDVLGIDITHPHDELYHQPSSALDEDFLRKLGDFDSLDGYHYLPLELVAAHKKTGVGAMSRKDKQDITLIRQYRDQNQ